MANDEDSEAARKRPLGKPPIGSNGRPQIWKPDTGWVDEMAGFNPSGIRGTRERKQTRKVLEKVAWLDEDDEDDRARARAASHKDDDDLTFGLGGATHRRASGGKRGSMTVSALERARTAAAAAPSMTQPASLAPPPSDFKPLSDLKGANASDVVGRRIRTWYEGDAGGNAGGDAGGDAGGAGGRDGSATVGSRSGLEPAVGIVTFYDPAGRLHAVYDGEHEADGLWVDGDDEWEWVDETDPKFAPPSRKEVFGRWRDDDVAEEIERIYLVRESTDREDH